MGTSNVIIIEFLVCMLKLSGANEIVSQPYIDLTSTCQNRTNVDLIPTSHRPHINFVKLFRKIVPCVTLLLRANQKIDNNYNTRLHILPLKCILIRIRQTPFFRP